MPGLAPGIHALLSSGDKNVDGRDKPGHDGRNRIESPRERLVLPGLGEFDLDAQLDLRQYRVETGIAGG